MSALKLYRSLLCALLLAAPPAGADNVSDLMGLGMPAPLAAVVGVGKIDSLTCTGDGAVGGTLGVTGKLTATGSVVYPATIIETKAAAGANQGNSTALTAGKFVHLVTAADETKGVVLPACAAANVGEIHFVLNSVANKFLNIWPASGAAINGASANAVYAAGAAGQGGKSHVCVCQSANTWYCG